MERWHCSYVELVLFPQVLSFRFLLGVFLVFLYCFLCFILDSHVHNPETENLSERKPVGCDLEFKSREYYICNNQYCFFSFIFVPCDSSLAVTTGRLYINMTSMVWEQRWCLLRYKKKNEVTLWQNATNVLYVNVFYWFVACGMYQWPTCAKSPCKKEGWGRYSKAELQ